jgi:hypothetical protein
MPAALSIDDYLPVYQFKERHEVFVDKTPAALLDVVMDPEVATDPWMRTFIKIREFPARLLDKFGISGALKNQAPFGIDNFLMLGRNADHEIVFGLLGKFWRPDYGIVSVPSPAEFHGFNQAGVAKLVLNFSAKVMDDGRTKLTTETRIFCNDRQSTIYLTLYWCLIRPISGLIRRRLLDRICKFASHVDTVL